MRLTLLILLSVVLMVAQHRQHALQKVRSALSLAVAPIQYLVDWPMQAAETFMTGLTSHSSLLDHNEKLRAKIFLLKGQLQTMTVLEKENMQLRALLQSSPRAKARVLVARLLAVDPDPFMRQVTLGKGKSDGVFIGQPVLDANGVMGQVIQVNPLTSQVLLITDTRSAVPVQDNRNGVRAIAVGTGSWGGLALQHVPKTTDIQVGDLLVTSGLGQRYPFGYPIGMVVSVVDRPGEHFADIKIKPAAHLNRSRHVLLVWPADKATLTEVREDIKQAQSKLQKISMQTISGGVR